MNEKGACDENRETVCDVSCPCAVQCRRCTGAGEGSGKTRQGCLSDFLRRQGAAALRTRGGTAAFVLVARRGKGVSRSAGGRSELRDRYLGDCVHINRKHFRRWSNTGRSAKS